MEPGQTLGRYRIENKLGQGGMGEVYRAWDSALQRWVALKVVPKTEAQLAARLLGEARAAAALRHANIVSVFDVGEDEAYAFVSLDLVEGRPLRDYVGDAATTPEQKRAWLLEIASALRVAHKAGIVHRDVKPDNVMISVDGTARVLDFGLAKSFSVDVQAATAHGDSGGPQAFLTGEGRVSGTPAYMAPEQLAGGPAAPAWDQYAWGMLACELLTGKHPRIAKLISVTGWVQAESLSHVPDELAQIVARAMAPTPDQRFPSMEAIVAALGGPLSSPAAMAGPSRPPGPLSTPPSPTMSVQIGDTLQVPVHPNAPVQPRSRVGLWALGVLVVSAAAGSVYAWRARAPAIVATVATVAPPAPSSSASGLATASASAIEAVSVAAPAVASSTAHVVVPPPPRKLTVRLRSTPSFQYDSASIDRMIRPMRPLVQSCMDQHPPRAVPTAMTIDLELWSIGQDEGKVRDVRVNEPQALAACLRDALLPLAFGPPKNPSMPPGGVFVTVDVE